MPTVAESDLLKIEVVAPDGDFSAWVRWNAPAVERFRKQAGEAVAVKLLRGLGKDFVESVEDIIARRTHPPGTCLPGCPYHGDSPKE